MITRVPRPRSSAASRRSRRGTAAVVALAVVGSLLPGSAVAGAAVAPPPLEATDTVEAADTAEHDHADHDHADQVEAEHDADEVEPPAADAGPAACGPGEEALAPYEPGQPWACLHADAPPPGVDPTVPVPLDELVARTGAATPTPMGAAATSAPAVACDGDGTSGHRVQAVYAYQTGRPNRFADLEAPIRRWAGGVDDVFAGSAARTGGARAPRWVTTGDGAGGCAVDVLVIEVSAEAMGSTGAMFRSLWYDHGLTAANRKYLVWADAFVLCGVGMLYGDDRPGQRNYNNGTSGSSMLARVDAGCWGMAQPSAEAHELVHMLGGVSSHSPNGTEAGHCHDEDDVMCYADGPGVVMRSVCPASQANLLDCNGDDYFTTLPAAGSWLASHWNVADNRFLLGGGDGVSGGARGRFRVDARAAAPTVPGTPTALRADVVVPPGTPWSVSWEAARLCRVLGADDGATVEVVCMARAATRPAATVTLTTPLGTTTSSVGLDGTGEARALSVRLVADGATTPWWDGCTAESYPVTVEVTDAATGAPVYGVALDVAELGLRAPYPYTGTGLDGRYTHPDRWRPQAGTYSIGTVATPGYPAARSVPVTAAAPDRCTTRLALDPLGPEVAPGSRVVVAGTVTSAETGAPMGGRRVRVTGTSAAGTAVVDVATGADGRFTATSAGLGATTTFTVDVGAAAPYGSAQATAGTVTVADPAPPTTTTTSTTVPPTTTTTAPPAAEPSPPAEPSQPAEPSPPAEPPSGSGRFADVPPGSYYDLPVGWLLENGITAGATAERFAPAASLTRAQMAVFLWRLAGTPAAATSSPFRDVPTTAHYAEAVAWARAVGITTGVDGDRFEPGRTVSRAQLVTFLHRFAGSPDVAAASPFTDVPAGAYYAGPAEWARRHGITSGVGGNRFDPTASTTRAQMAAFLHRFVLAAGARDVDSQPVVATA